MSQGIFSNLFKPKAEAILGVDISSTAIKIVELSGRTMDSIELAGYAIERLPKDAITDGNLNDIEQISETIRRARKKLTSRTKNVATCLPTGMVFAKKVVKAGDLSEEELEFQIEADANQYIPFSLDEVNIDFQVLGPSKIKSSDIDVLLAAARKEKIEERVVAIEASGLKAKVVDVDSYAVQAASVRLAQQLPRNAAGLNIAVFDIGSSSARLYVMRDFEVIFTRESSFGGNQLTQDIQRAYSLTAEQAENAKLANNLPNTYAENVLKPYQDALASELARALQFFLSSTTYQKVDHIFLAGGCAKIPRLIENIMHRTNAPVSIANPFKGLQTTKQFKDINQDAPELLTAFGLALRRFSHDKT